QKKIRPDVLASLRQQQQDRVQAEIKTIKQQLSFLDKFIEILEADEKRLEEADRMIPVKDPGLSSVKEEIARAEALAKRIGAEIATTEVELLAPPRVTLVEH